MTARAARSPSNAVETRWDRETASENATPPVHPVITRVPLALVADVADRRRPRACTRCGSMGFNLHQRSWRTVRDPQVKGVLVTRYVCKRCGMTCRVYPVGIGKERQSVALKQICAILYCLGLTYRNVQHILDSLSCSLSMTTIRQNVLEACADEEAPRPFDRLHLSPAGPGQLRGPDGEISVRIIGTSPMRRWLELETHQQASGAELDWRVQTCAQHFTARGDDGAPSTGN